MNNFTIERTKFVLGAVLAPFASRFASAGVEPRRSFTEFVLRLPGVSDEFCICVTDDGDIEKVAYGVNGKTFQMSESSYGSTGDLRGRIWKLFACDNGPNRAKIRLRVKEDNMIDVDWLIATEDLS